MTALYRKQGRKYVQVGVEFNGMPADGVWLISRGGASRILIIPEEHLPNTIDLFPRAVLEQRRLACSVEITNAMMVGGLSKDSIIDAVFTALTKPENEPSW